MIVIALLALGVSALVRSFTIWNTIRKYENGKAKLEKTINEKQIELDKKTVEIEAKEKQIQEIIQKNQILETAITESNKKLEDISKQVRDADTNLERVKAEKSINATVSSTCESLKKAGLECQ